MCSKPAYPQRLFFYHNPKAGGMALTAMLARVYGADRISPVIENDLAGHQAARHDYARFRGHDIYAGHYGRDVFDAVATDHVEITTIRHPVDRVISLYGYFRFAVDVDPATLALPHYAAVRAAKTLDLESFVTSDDPVVALYTGDMLARQLTRSPWLPAVPDADALPGVIDRLRWFYLVDQPDASLAWARRTLGWTAQALDRVNTRPAAADATLDRHSVAPRLAAMMHDRNRLDTRLYELACERLTKEG